MRFATLIGAGGPSVAVVRGGLVLPLAIRGRDLGSMRAVAASGAAELRRIRDWIARQPERAWLPLDAIRLGPVVPDPGAIYTIGLNYAAPGEAEGAGPERPLVYAKLPTAVTGQGATITWDRALTPNVDAEVELAVVIG